MEDEEAIKSKRRQRSSSNVPHSCPNHMSGSESPRSKRYKHLATPIQADQRLERIEAAKIQNASESQRSNQQVLERNRRMFGLLMGTLKQFKNEESGREVSTLKRSKVEEKLAKEEEQILEVEIDRKRPEPSRKKQDSPEEIDAESDVMSRFKNWEKTHRHLGCYIQTESKPKIFWLPKEHNSATERRLKETKDYFSLCVAERIAKLKKEL